MESINIHRSLELLSDTATIKLPGRYFKKALDIKAQLKKGDAVLIDTGYDDELSNSFQGFLKDIKIDKGTIELECEDAMYLTRKKLPNKELKNATLLQLMQEVTAVMGDGYEAETSYSRTWDKFVFKDTNGFEVLDKLREECGLNIFLNEKKLIAQTKDTTNAGQVVAFDFEMNVQVDGLRFRSADEKAYEVTVEGITKEGKRKSVKIGTEGGDHRKIIITAVLDEETLKKRGEEEMKALVYDGYEGDLTVWLLPRVMPGQSTRIIDNENPAQTGNYLAVSVTEEISASGGTQKITIGRKLA
jgi:hypothetical protein